MSVGQRITTLSDCLNRVPTAVPGPVYLYQQELADAAKRSCILALHMLGMCRKDGDSPGVSTPPPCPSWIMCLPWDFSTISAEKAQNCCKQNSHSSASKTSSVFIDEGRAIRRQQL